MPARSVPSKPQTDPHTPESRDLVVAQQRRSSSRLATAEDLVPVGTNLVIVRGTIRRGPEFRVLPSGDEVLSLDLIVRHPDMPAESVPIVWQNPSSAAAKLNDGDEVVVVGRARRRFFRAGGATTSRTEVQADRVVSARASARVRTLVGHRLDELNLD